VLLHDVDGGGRVERLRLSRVADGSGDPWLHECAAIFGGVCVALSGRGRSLGEGLRVWPFSLPGVPAERGAGPSRGLAHAASLAVQIAADVSVAGSARVLHDGRLAPVEHLRGKLAEVERLRGCVRTVVVAEEQGVPDDVPARIRIVRCRTVGDAMAVFGLKAT